jgi:HAD superfamily phosphoserine phosphatase-like hydrolase
MDNFRALFADILKEVLLVSGVTEGELSAEMDLSQPAVSFWVTGKHLPGSKNFHSLSSHIDSKLSDGHIDTSVKLCIEELFDKHDVGKERYDVYSRNTDSKKDYLLAVMRQCWREARKDRNKLQVAKKNPSCATRAVVFDFDGTLTKSKGENIWQKIWIALGYSKQECEAWHKKFDKGDITHQQWCAITAEKFKAKSMTKSMLREIIGDIELIDDVEYVFNHLKERKIDIYVVSGSIKCVIQQTLGSLIEIDKIKANEFVFADNGKLEKIIGTAYDFEGKSKFINELATKLGIRPTNILFVGNSRNDEWVYESGAKAICLNPHITNPKKHWHDYEYSDTLKVIIDYIAE